MKLFLTSIFLAFPALSHSALITWDAGAGADRSWQNATNWSDDSLPSSANDYTVSGSVIIRPPSPPLPSTGDSSYTFGGKSLTIGSGATLMPYRDGDGFTGRTLTLTIPTLTVAGGTIQTNVGYATSHVILTSGIDFQGGGTLLLGNVYGTYTCNTTLSGALTGNGTIAVQRTAQGTGRELIVNGSTSAFTGNWALSGGLSADVLVVTLNSGSNGWGTGGLTAAEYTTLNVNAPFSSINNTLDFAPTGSTLSLGANIGVGSFNIGGTAIPVGTYTASALTAMGLGGTYTGSGTLTVIPEPSLSFLLLLPAAALLSIRRR